MEQDRHNKLGWCESSFVKTIFCGAAKIKREALIFNAIAIIHIAVAQIKVVLLVNLNLNKRRSAGATADTTSS